jgi:hypothetical protein
MTPPAPWIGSAKNAAIVSGPSFRMMRSVSERHHSPYCSGVMPLFAP